MNQELKYWYLRNHKLFWVLNNSQVKQLCVIIGFKQAKKGDIIYLAESDEARIYFLKKGSIKIVDMDKDGNEIIKDIIQKGDLFGELTLESEQNEEYAVALTNDVVICSFLLSDFEKILHDHPDLAISYTKLVGWHLKKLKNNYSNLIFKDAKSRLLTFLNDWTAKEGNEQDGKIVIKNYFTQSDIAQIICTSRQTATQMINNLEEEGILKYERKEIHIFKPELLNQE
jgi:CRP/FNR family cyclic AMP-dependent transcriptional regulator